MKTVIGPETRIAGALSGKDDLEVHGTVDGPVRGEAPGDDRRRCAHRRRGARARRHHRRRARARGLRHAARCACWRRRVLTGDIEAPRIAIDEGAIFDGQVRMRKKARPRRRAVADAARAPSPAPPVQAMPATRAIPELAAPGRKPLIRKSS